MFPRAGWCVVVAAMMLYGAEPSVLSAQEPKKDAELSLNDVGLEINAYQMLRQFEFSFGQMEQLQKWAKETAQKDRPRDNKTSKEFAEKLREVHKAYVANDDERIDQLSDDMEQLRESQKPTLDDGVDITDAARKRAAEAFRSLKPRQLATYLGKVSSDAADPFDRLQGALDEVRPLKGAEWRNKRDEIADELSRLVAGLDRDKADKVNDQVVALLIRAHDLSDADFQKQRADLDAAARKIVGNVSAHDVLRNQTELSLAELLSNPRLHAALSVRLK
jgi:hypothetical protein